MGKWITNKNTLEYLSIWEKINNANFNYPEFGVIEKEAGVNRFIMSVGQWIERTKANGLVVKAGRFGGTFAHKDIAFHFAMWLSPEFQIYLINEFQRLKEEEQKQIGWTAKRELSKLNYHIHTDAIKQNLIPAELTPIQTSIIYANEADVLNVAMFGITAKQWRDANPDLKGNIRDYASINELICLANMENLNAVYINEKMPQQERLIKLNQIAIHQMKVLHELENRKLLK
ncbi:MAG: KilA-N domain-containing protein [Paludibacter sp.]|nr:KilA-N domain-containing protein [Paludibacter sp.]